MRKKTLITLVTIMLSLPLVASAATWYNPLTWFKKNKKVNSTTVTGNVEYIIEGQVVFKTIDGQVILLIGKKAASVASVNNYIVRVFGNVYAPSDVYPRGAISVRNFRVLEEIPIEPAEPVVEPTEPEIVGTPYMEPEPYLEPEPVMEVVSEPEVSLDDEQHPGVYDGPIVADDNDDEESLVEPAFEDYQKYVVQPGDSLGKISGKIFGTSTRWKEIAELNTINNPRALRVGMTLKIPVE